LRDWIQGTSPNVVNQGYLETPLHRAAIKGDVAIVQELLRANANIQAQRSGGFTPLHTAETNEVARVLLDHGADPSAVADNGRSPLEQCAGGAGVQAFIAGYKPQYVHRCMYGNQNVQTAASVAGGGGGGGSTAVAHSSR
jgi:ankyrin repeat protein